MSVVFSAPAALGGLAASALPVVIHLINRRRVRDLVFPPTPLLQEIARRRSRSLILQHWLLLLLRTLIIALLVTTVAGPLWRRPVPLLEALPQAGRVAVILDDSASTGYRLPGGRSLFDGMRDGAAGLLDGAGGGTVLAVTTTSALVSSGMPGFAGKGQARRELAALQPGFGNVPHRGVIGALEDESRSAPLQAWLLTDDTARPWDGFSAASLDSVSGALDLRVLVFPLPGDAANLAVVDAAPLPTGGLAVKVANGGRVPATGRILEVGAAGAPAERFVIDLPPGGQRLVAVSVRGEANGVKVEAGLDADPLPVDDRFVFRAIFPPSLPVLLVNGRQAPPGPERPDFFLAQALAPGSRIAPPAPIVPREAHEPLPADLSPYGAVILAEPAAPDVSGWATLLPFVREGGGLVVYPSKALAEAVLPAQAALLAPGLPLSPAVYDPPATIRPLALDDPLLVPLGADGPAMLSDTLVRSVYRTAGLPPAWETVLATERGDPLLVRSRVGKGTVYWFLTGAGVGASDLPLRPIYLPLVQAIVRGVLASGATSVSFRREASPARWLAEEAIDPPDDEWDLVPITRDRAADLLGDLPGPVAITVVSEEELVPVDRDLVLPLLLALVSLLLAEGWLSERRLADES